jgi:hypothetical protein
MSATEKKDTSSVSESAKNIPTQDSEEELLTRAVLRLNANVLGFVLGVLFSLGIFVATNWLVIKSGDVVGPHLSLLSQYFIGYSVSFVGSLIGVLYAFVLGYVSGLIIAWVYNQIVAVSLRKN